MDPILAIPALIVAGGILILSLKSSSAKIDNVSAARERASKRAEEKMYADTAPIDNISIKEIEIDKLDIAEVNNKYLNIGELTDEERRIANTILAGIDVSYIDDFDKPNSIFGKDNKIEEDRWPVSR